MNSGAEPRRSTPMRWAWRRIPVLGAVFIVLIAALAVYDILAGHRGTLAQAASDLDMQARIIADQTARSTQAVDLVLRHVARQTRTGDLDALDADALRTYLTDQAVGLPQVTGLTLIDGRGQVRASAGGVSASSAKLAGVPALAQAADRTAPPLIIDKAMPSLRGGGEWVIPIMRRLETAQGDDAGVILAEARVGYFSDFYGAVRADEATKITLVHHDGTLLARHPPIESALGQRSTLFDSLLGTDAARTEPVSRVTSPVDGVDRMAALRRVPDYPLAIIVARDVDAVLAPWRRQAQGAALRTLALGMLAALMLGLFRSQLAHLDRTRDSLEASKERFALAAAGADVGIWDWDVDGERVFASGRAREIFGLSPGPELQPRAEWFAQVDIHPDDVEARRAAINAHFDGKTPDYEHEFRVRDRQTGHYRWIRVRGLCIRDAQGRAVRMAGSVADIDASKRAEDALRLSEERYALAMTGLSGGHWVWDVETDALFVSAPMNLMFGLPPQTQPGTRRAYFKLAPVHPDDRLRLKGLDRAVRRGEARHVELEYRVVLPGTQETRWILTRAQCFRDRHGQPLRVAGVSVDVTERKRTEEALRLSEERFALAVAGSNDGIVDWDIVNDRMYTSERTMEILGVDSSITVRSRAQWLKLLPLHPDDRQRHADELARFFASDATLREGEYRMLGPKGEARWVRLRNLCVRGADGRPLRLAGSVSDIDAYKRVETALRGSEERYALAVAGSSEGLWDWDLSTDMLFLSQRAQELLWLKSGETQRARQAWIEMTPYHPEDVARIRRALSDHLRGGTRHFEVEYRVQHHSGHWHWYRQRGVAVRDGQGRPTRMAGSIEDITERKNIEADRERLESALRQAQKLEAIGTLAGGIAHDFNNILAAILGYGEMAQKDAPEGTAQRRHIDAALSAGMRAKSLVERILAFSRTGVAERVPVHVESVVAEALDLVAASLPQGITLVRELHSSDAAIMGDPTQIHQVVMNLCANAVQAMKSSGTLTVTLDLMGVGGSRCATSVLSNANHIRLRVSDTGAGIPASLIERIFDPFFTTKEVGVGTGLGLSLVHGIVTDLGGGIEVASQVGQGSVFTVHLPWQSCVPAPTQVAPEPEAQGHGETILLVDDEEALVRLGEEVIAELGYEPVGFTSSLAALEAVRADPGRFQALLSDEAMPEMTGSELVLEIRKLRPDMPLILMSGYVTSALGSRARSAGVIDVLAKPIVVSDLARTLARALQPGPVAIDTAAGAAPAVASSER